MTRELKLYPIKYLNKKKSAMEAQRGKYKTYRKQIAKVNINSTLSVIKLNITYLCYKYNINTLNIPIKRKILPEWVEKLDSAIYMLSTRDTLWITIHQQFVNKRMAKDIPWEQQLKGTWSGYPNIRQYGL